MNTASTHTLRYLAPLGALLLGAAAGAFAGDATISAGKLARDAKDFYGKTVTVSAEVEDVIGAHSFTLDEDSVLAGADVLVLVPHGLAATIRKDDKVLVTGTVRRYVTAELEKDYDWFEDGEILKSSVKVDFDARPVLVATAIRTADGRDLVARPAVAATTTTGTTPHHHGGAHAVHEAISAGKLARDAKKMYGKTVTVRAEVEDVIDAHSFTLDEDATLAGPDVLVLVPAGLAQALAEDQVVEVTGTVRPYVVSELDREFEWFEDGKIVQRKTRVDFETRPVLVATSVRTAAGRDLASR